MLKLIVGSGGIKREGWISTDVDYLDIRHWRDWERFISSYDNPDVILCEHVLEHLHIADACISLCYMHRALTKGGRVRIALPDPRNRHPEYRRINDIKEHVNNWTVEEICEDLEIAGFDRAVPLEWFDAQGQFHCEPMDDALGYVDRAHHHDARNLSEMIITSVIVDGFKSA